MIIHTLTLSEDLFGGYDLQALGSYRDSEHAITACIDAIVDMALGDSNFALALWHDENHEDFQLALCETRPRKEVENWFDREEGTKAVLPVDVLQSMRHYLEGEIGNGFYIYYDNGTFPATYKFDILENEMKDQA